MKNRVCFLLVMTLILIGDNLLAQAPASVKMPQQEDIPAIFATIEAKLQEEKYEETIAIINDGLVKDPKDYRLIMLKSFIYFKNLDQFEESIKVIDEAIATNPQVFDLYDFKLQLIRQHNAPNKNEQMMEVYETVAVNYKNQPVTMSELGFALLKQQIGEMRLIPAMLLLKTAKENMENMTPSQKYLICTNLARGYYFASRADLAKQEQKTALSYADNEIDTLQGQQLYNFYDEAEDMSKRLD